MKYSDRFFKIPVRIYDRFSYLQSLEEEKATNQPTEGDWVAGYARIPLREISSWNDYYDSKQGVEGVMQEGFKYTLVFTHNEGTLISIWDRKTFEDKMDEYASKVEKYEKEEIEKLRKQVEVLK